MHRPPGFASAGGSLFLISFHIPSPRRTIIRLFPSLRSILRTAADHINSAKDAKMDRHETRETGRFVAKDAAGNDHEIVRTQDFVSYDFQGGTMQLAGRKHLSTAVGGSKVTRKGKGKYLIAGTTETPITTLDLTGR
jgi:hypothetical protein